MPNVLKKTKVELQIKEEPTGRFGVYFYPTPSDKTGVKIGEAKSLKLAKTLAYYRRKKNSYMSKAQIRVVD